MGLDATDEQPGELDFLAVLRLRGGRPAGAWRSLFSFGFVAATCKRGLAGDA